MGVDKEGKELEVYVEHIPYTDQPLSFTNGRQKLDKNTGKIITSESGLRILGTTLWNGTVVLDEKGSDVTTENQMFISLAKFDSNENKYGAVKRIGKDKAGKEITVYVEHKPYTGGFTPQFTFCSA